MAEDNKTKQNNDRGFEAQGKHKSHKKKKNSKIYTIIIVLLFCVMGYSGYQIISTVIRDKKAKNTYEDIINDFVVVIPDDETEIEPSGEAETQEQPSAEVPSSATPSADPTMSAESTEQIMTIDGSDAVTQAPQTTAPQTQPAQSEAPMPKLSVDFARLKNINSDVCAWLQGQGGLVNYPVVQGSDNSYYLKHLIDGSYNGNGTLFVHAQNHFLQDDVTYIFGHHMQSGAMFGSLKKYDSSSYYWSNPEFKLYTPNKTYTLKIYAVYYGTGTDQITFNYSSEASFNSAMAKYASRSLHSPQVNVSYGDKLVCLCTCAYQVDDGRYFVLCKVMN